MSDSKNLQSRNILQIFLFYIEFIKQIANNSRMEDTKGMSVSYV